MINGMRAPNLLSTKTDRQPSEGRRDLASSGGASDFKKTLDRDAADRMSERSGVLREQLKASAQKGPEKTLSESDIRRAPATYDKDRQVSKSRPDLKPPKSVFDEDGPVVERSEQNGLLQGKTADSSRRQSSEEAEDVGVKKSGRSRAPKSTESDSLEAKSVDRANDSPALLGAMGMTGLAIPAIDNFWNLQEPQPSVDVKSISTEDLETYRDIQAQNKQMTMQNFMIRMQSEFGISPDRIVNAFAKMSESSLLAPPQEAKADFLENLDVPEPMQAQIGQMYQELVTETGEADLNQKLAMPKTKPDLSLELMTSREMRIRQLNDSLDKMNTKFFMKGADDKSADASLLGSSAFGAGLKARSVGAGAGDMTASQVGAGATSAVAANTPTAGFEPMSTLNLATLATGTTQAMNASMNSGPTNGIDSAALKSQSMLVDGEDDVVMDEGALPFSQSAAESPSMAIHPNANHADSQQRHSSDRGQQNSNAEMMALAAQSQVAQRNSGAQSKEFTSELSGKTAGGSEGTSSLSSSGAGNSTQTVDPGSVLAAGIPVTSTVTTAAGASAGTAGMMLAGQPSKAEEAANIQDLINKAQVVMRQGGGEMRVEMRPEGMGHVDLKISVQDGNVNVQMVTQNDKAKKMLEESLQDLKSNLAANKLHVESVKIGVADDGMSKNLDSKSQDQKQEMANQAARDFASSFMGNQRDEREAFRNAFAGSFGPRGYRRDSERANLSPAPVVQSDNDTKESRWKGDTNRRLNVVA